MDYKKVTKQQLVEYAKSLEAKIKSGYDQSYYGSLLNSISTIVLVVDSKGRITYSTPSFEWILGYTFEEIRDKNILEFIYAEDTPRIEEIFSHVMERNGASMIIPETRFHHKREACIYLDGDISNQTHRGNIHGLIMTFYDITQKKLYEMDYARLLSAVRISADSFMLTDNSGNIIFVNNAAMHLLNVDDKSQLIGKNIFEFISEDDVKDVLMDNTIGRESIKIIEHGFNLSGSGIVPVESSIAIVSDSERNKIGYVYISRDISERKKVEAEIEQYRNHLEELVDARTYELNQSMKKLRTTLEGIIQSMAHTVEYRDAYTAGHQKRVAEIACKIAEVMNLDNDMIESIKMAALIHDLGKINIPAEILNKHGKLDEIEFMLVKKHPKVGYDILKTIEFPWPIAEIVYQHHEKIDGSGYPNGLKGDQILLEARIICVSDVVEAMTFPRPYKHGLGLESAMEEISANRNLLYDGDVVDACLELFKEKGFRFT